MSVSCRDAKSGVDRFGVRRSNEGFWWVYNAINPAHLAVQSGTLDLTRYALEKK
jgi:hypothetical protein